MNHSEIICVALGVRHAAFKKQYRFTKLQAIDLFLSQHFWWVVGVGSLVTFVRAGSGHGQPELAVDQWNATDSCVPPPGVGSGSRLGDIGRVGTYPHRTGRLSSPLSRMLATFKFYSQIRNLNVPRVTVIMAEIDRYYQDYKGP